MSEILNTSGEFYFAIFGEYSIATYTEEYLNHDYYGNVWCPSLFSIVSVQIFQ